MPKYSKKREWFISLHKEKKAIEPQIESGMNNGTILRDTIFAVDDGIGSLKNRSSTKT